MSKKVRTLLRVSSRQQLYDNDIPIQRAEAAQYIKLHPDWLFDKEYIEKAVSAYKNSVEDREVLQEILADAKAHQFDILLTYMSDRIGRQEEYSFYVAALNRLGIEVWTIKDGQLKTEEHVDKLLNYIRFWQNEGESKKTSMRVRDTQKELIKAGKFVGGRAPFGYKLVPSGLVSNHGRLLKKPVIVEENAKIVEEIYRLAVYRGMGYEKIAKTLNEEGVPAIETKMWKAGTIAGILKNPIYMGYLCINRRENHGSFKRLDRRDWIYSEEQIKELVIISPKLWEKAQEIREARKQKLNTFGHTSAEQYQIPFNTKGRLTLIGLVHCGYCGMRLKNGSYYNHWTTKTGEEKVSYTGRYICPKKCKERGCYSRGYIEDSVFEAAENFLEEINTIDISSELRNIFQWQNADMERERKQIRKQQKSLQQDIETLEEKIPEAIRGEYYFSAEKLSDMIYEKTQTLLELDNAIEKIEDKLNDIRLQYGNREKYSAEKPNWKQEFRNADIQTKQMLLACLIERIDIKDGDINIGFKVSRKTFMTHV